MQTKRRFQELTEKAQKTGVGEHREGERRENVGANFVCEPDSLARVIALSEFLGISCASVIDELLRSALGDAHDGFLLAFVDTEEREQANTCLKRRVKELRS